MLPCGYTDPMSGGRCRLIGAEHDTEGVRHDYQPSERRAGHDRRLLARPAPPSEGLSIEAQIALAETHE